ncbi:MAG: hypothetical protein HOP36_04220 [Methyloglobulus sp.]|nr:hypothetical protein [Methyloglobulus sp.]
MTVIIPHIRTDVTQMQSFHAAFGLNPVTFVLFVLSFLNHTETIRTGQHALSGGRIWSIKMKRKN